MRASVTRYTLGFTVGFVLLATITYVRENKRRGRGCLLTGGSTRSSTGRKGEPDDAYGFAHALRGLVIACGCLGQQCEAQQVDSLDAVEL